MSCNIQDCLKGEFTRFEGSEMMGTLSLIDSTNDCFDYILEYIKKALSNLPINQPLHLPLHGITLDRSQYTLSMFALPTFKTINPDLRKPIPVFVTGGPEQQSLPNPPSQGIIGSPNDIINNLRQMAITNPYNPILFIFRVDILLPIDPPTSTLSEVYFGSGRQIFLNDIWQIAENEDIRINSGVYFMYNSIEFVYKPSYPITEITTDELVEDVEDISTNPDLVLFKFEPGTENEVLSFKARNFLIIDRILIFFSGSNLAGRDSLKFIIN